MTNLPIDWCVNYAESISSIFLTVGGTDRIFLTVGGLSYSYIHWAVISYRCGGATYWQTYPLSCAGTEVPYLYMLKRNKWEEKHSSDPVDGCPITKEVFNLVTHITYTVKKCLSDTSSKWNLILCLLSCQHSLPKQPLHGTGMQHDHQTSSTS